MLARRCTSLRTQRGVTPCSPCEAISKLKEHA
jgi:hypothetical protein